MPRAASCLALLLAIAACGTQGTLPDTGTRPDAATSLDATPNPDATTPDATPNPDATAPDATANDAAAADAEVSPDAGLLPFGAPCTDNPECETGLCFSFAARGRRCTAACVNGACPVPPGNQGCNNMGVCRVP